MNRDTILVIFLIAVAKYQLKEHKGGSVCFGSCFERVCISCGRRHGSRSSELPGGRSL